MNLKTIILAALIGGAPLLTHAQSGTFSVAGAGDSFTPGLDITAATNFYITDLAVFFNNTGVFAGLTPFGDHFGSVSFTPNSVVGFSITNADVGTFVASSDLYVSSDSTHASYELFGIYNSGTFDGGVITNTPASIFFNFALIGGNLQMTGTFSIPPIGSPVPEPATMALAALGGVSLLLLRRRK